MTIPLGRLAEFSAIIVLALLVALVCVHFAGDDDPA